jgi:hypothetical protein
LVSCNFSSSIDRVVPLSCFGEIDEGYFGLGNSRFRVEVSQKARPVVVRRISRGLTIGERARSFASVATEGIGPAAILLARGIGCAA